MKNSLYLKIILTVIAVLLLVNALVVLQTQRYYIHTHERYRISFGSSTEYYDEIVVATRYDKITATYKLILLKPYKP